MPIPESLAIRAGWEGARLIARAVPRGISAYRFGKFFGGASLRATGIVVVLDPYEHPAPRGTAARYVKRMDGRGPDLHVIGEDVVLGKNTIRVVSHFTHFFTTNSVGGKTVPFVLDREASSEWDRTFFCTGSPDTNIKTFDIFALPEQRFVRAKYGAAGLRVWEMQGVEYGFESGRDRAVLLKMRNPHFPKHSLVVCAGLGEWGSTGAAWFLTRKWAELAKRFGTNDFCMIIEVNPGNDESAREVAASS